jgi:serine/threonine-protein kinase
MGDVYLGHQLSTGGRVAIKIMSTQQRAKKTIDRFRYEAETTAQLTHPNTVRILDFGADQDLFYLVMEHLSGTDLTRFLRVGGQSDAFVSHILFQVVCSLAEAHSRGVIHRDIKPNNIMLLHHVGCPSFVKVIDFGIARAIGGPGLGTLGILGTIGYIAPEQAAGESAPDARTDIYALGCVAYELLTGRLPFDGITHQSAPIQVLEAHKSGQPRPILDVKPGTDPELADLIMTLLSREPDARPPTTGELVVPLHRIRSRCSAGVAYAIDIPDPGASSAAAYTHQDAAQYDLGALADDVDQTLADPKALAEAFRGASGSATLVAGPQGIGLAQTVLPDGTSAPPAASIPPPLHEASREPESVVPEEDAEAGWSLGEPPGTSPDDADEDTTRISDKRFVMFFMLAGLMSILTWLLKSLPLFS